jgi:3-oxoacyl-[acyl-carrier protein] reductase
MALLEHHIAVVTGAASGIGRAIAAGYAREGAQVALLDINEQAAEEAAEEIRREGGRASSFRLDVTKREEASANGSGGFRSWSTMPASTAATRLPVRPRP